MSFSNHVSDLLPAYAIGSLDEEEAVLVSKHLASCAACRAEMQEYQAVVDRLPLAVPQFDPPAEVKARLMDQVQASIQAKQVRGEETPWWESLVNFFRRAAPLWGLASLVLILALVTSNVFLWNQVNNLRSQAARTMRVVNLSGTKIAPQATGLIVISLDGEHGTLVVDHMPGLPENQEYQLWLIKDGVRTNGGVFSVSKDGYGSLWVKSPQPLASYSAIGITIEPKGGSPGPTGEKVLGGSL